jgi:hypothetical protein
MLVAGSSRIFAVGCCGLTLRSDVGAWTSHGRTLRSVAGRTFALTSQRTSSNGRHHHRWYQNARRTERVGGPKRHTGTAASGERLAEQWPLNSGYEQPHMGARAKTKVVKKRPGEEKWP